MVSIYKLLFPPFLLLYFSSFFVFLLNSSPLPITINLIMSYAAGAKFPTDVKLLYVPYTAESDSILVCSRPIPLDLEKVLPGKTVVFVAAPGAFTPTCTEKHIPEFVEKYAELKSKGVDEIIILTVNDPFVNSAWGKALGAKDNLKFATDPLAALSKELGHIIPNDPLVGQRTARYAVVVKDGTIIYNEVATTGDVKVSGADAVLAAL